MDSDKGDEVASVREASDNVVALFSLKPNEPTDAEVFDRFWLRYPRKVAKGRARKAWTSACKRLRAAGRRPEDIIAGLDDRIAFFRSDVQFIQHPATWLNAEGYDDDIASLRAASDSRSAPRPSGFATDRQQRAAEAEAWHARQKHNPFADIEAREDAEGAGQQPRFVANLNGER